ncbi:MAG: YkvA family protein [Bacillota bacterium]|nr:YkvA family protein [Bacillota bacterium]
MINKRKIELEKEQQKYEEKAKDFIQSPEKMEKLLKTAFEKAFSMKGSLKESWERLLLFIDLIKAYKNREYRDVSTGTILTVLGAIIYFVSPLDLIPDFITGLGMLDDAAVIHFAIKKIGPELDAFQEWKRTNT